MSGVFYFGKLPSRGDFVKGGQVTAVIQSLDTWVARSLDQLLAEPKGREDYDAAAPVNFLFGSTRGRHFIAGRLVVSHDLSRRRYPLILGTLSQSDEPLPLLARAPLLLAESWARFASVQQQAMAAQGGSESLQELDSLLPQRMDLLSAQQAYIDFVAQHDLNEVAQWLRADGRTVDLRRSLLALGVLLRPLLTQLKPSISKSLMLPLPAEKPRAALVAAMWMDLTLPFLARAELEVTLLFSEHRSGPSLLLGFCGAQPYALLSAWQPHAHREAVIDLCDAGWIAEVLRQDVSLTKLAGLLQQPSAALAPLIRTFRETFTGA